VSKEHDPVKERLAELAGMRAVIINIHILGITEDQFSPEDREKLLNAIDNEWRILTDERDTKTQ